MTHDRRRMRLLAGAMLAVVALLCAAAPGQALAKTETASLGAVTATLSYPSDPVSADPQLTITRDGQVLYDDRATLEACSEEPCFPEGAGELGPDGGSLLVRQLDATPDPEVVLRMYTRGAHCCTVAQVWRLDRAGAAPAFERNFGNRDFDLRDADGDGRDEFWTSDDRFSYRFASFASSGAPVRVFAYEGAALSDVTTSFRSAVAADAGRWWRYYRRASHYKRERLGLLAAWAADEYLLGRRQYAASVIRRERRLGNIAKRSWNNKPFLKDLQGFLNRLGY